MRTLCLRLLLVSTVCLLAAPTLRSVAADAPDDPRAHQFDFWLGDWDLTWKGGSGTNTITREYDGAVIMEHFVGQPSIPLNGMSVSVFNRKTGKWNQTWVDNQGGYLDFVGGFSDGKMILQRHATISDRDILQRMVWSDITADSLEWSWERSEDDGGSWKPQWKIHYRRKSK